MRITSAFLMATAMFITGCNQSETDRPVMPASAVVQEYSPQEKAALLASFPTPYNEADLEAGAIQYGKCRSCHTVSADKVNLTGPHLYGLFGRKAGSEPDYPYTAQMKAHEVVWDFESLDTFIRSPQTVVKGTKMGYMGIKDDIQRRDLIAWLAIQTRPLETSVLTATSEITP